MAECLIEDKQFYIVCPQDVVVAKPRSADDRIEWLLEHDKHKEALEVSSETEKVVIITISIAVTVITIVIDH